MKNKKTDYYIIKPIKKEIDNQCLQDGFALEIFGKGEGVFLIAGGTETCFSFRALKLANKWLRKQGYDV